MNDKVPHLLLINPSAEDRAVLRGILDQFTMRISEVASGLEAIELLRSTVFDLVVTDIEIGSFDCWRLARIIRSDIYPSDKSLPIIIVTRIWCERITRVTARDFDINGLLAFDDREQLPQLVSSVLASAVVGLEPQRVLVVEDHADNARLVGKVLQQRFEVEIAPDGVQGLEAWKQRRHDLVLLDVMLPGLSGEDILEEILATDPLQPVVVMTAHGTMDLAEKMMLRGAADFITKPFRNDQLRKVCDLAARREDYLLSHGQFVSKVDDLKQLQGLLNNIIDSMPSVLIGIDQHGRITLWNQQAEQVTGQVADAVLGAQLADVAPGLVDLASVELALQEKRLVKFDKQVRRQAGKLHYFDLTIYPLQDSRGAGAVIRVDDVTQRTLLEGRIVQSEKLASMGELAAGMAHEINNPLAGILQNIQVLRNRLDVQAPKNLSVAESLGIDKKAFAGYLEQRDIVSRLNAIMDSGVRAARLIETMLRFSRQGEGSLQPNNLEQLLDRSVELAESHFSLKRRFDFRMIQIERDYPAEPQTVECDAGQIQQVFLSLLLNGALAMEDKCRCRSDFEDYQPEFVLRLSYAEQTAQIQIVDNGPGMTAEAQEKIFEPYFTVQDPGVGPGLGLSVAYFIITKNHQGSMSVESTEGCGTRFMITLPLTSLRQTQAETALTE